MRRVTAVVCLFNLGLAGIASSAPGDAHSTTATVQVKLAVADACKVQTPAVPPPVDGNAKTALARESVLSGCSDDGARAEVSIAADNARKGSYVATVDF